MMFAAGMLSVWTALLLTAAVFYFCSKACPIAATTATPRLLQFHLREIALRWIAESAHHGAKKLRPSFRM